ncbi:hypothetical protein ACHAXA_003449 [Cyclostephanos tholiformis]|uniref:Oligopeptidase A n=1 Tax=Cyclostephanos tholiformis TaxID=382380 RepID=A0ABD3R243_9STRA
MVNALLHQSSSTATHSAASSPSHAASIVASRVNMSSAVEAASVTSSVASSNPLLECTDLPKFTAIEPSQLTPAIGSILEKLEADFAALEAKLVEGVNEKVIMRYDDVLPVVERMQHPLGYAWGIASHLNGVKNGDELRAAYEENQPKIVNANMKFSQSKPLYDALLAVQRGWEGTEDGECKDDDVDDFATAQRRRAIENAIRSMKLGGVGFEEGSAEQIRYKEIKMRQAELSTAFSNNVLDATKAFGLVVTSPEDVDGVPKSARAMWAQAYRQDAIKECKDDDEKKRALEDAKIDASSGPWRITLDGPSYIAAMQHLPNRALRKEVYMGYMTRASEFTADILERMDEEKRKKDAIVDEKEEKKDKPGKNNVPIIKEILKNKKELAGLLGYSNYAEMSLASKMAPSVTSVADLSNLILEKALPAAERELAAATALAREQGGDEYSETNLEKLMPWDTSFWIERLKEKTFELKEEELRPYFALDAVLEGMFKLIERIFDIEVRDASGKAEVWHPDVQFFELYDKGSGEHVASFFLDPYSRPADKRGGAWMADCLGKSEALGINVPVAYLTCNGSPPVGDKPSLMTFREVETLFHETGHGLQHMLTRATDSIPFP